MVEKKNKLTERDCVNWWLEKYHNTNIDKVLKQHPEWDDGKEHSREFYKTYPVTQKQHDEWREWLIKALKKETHMGRKVVERNMWPIYLNTSPSVKDDN